MEASNNMLESTLVRKIKAALEAEGCKVIKIHGGPNMEAGTPDLIGCYPGKSDNFDGDDFWIEPPGCFAIEVKRDAKHKPTALQLKRLEEWKKAGAKTGVVWTVDMALEVVKG